MPRATVTTETIHIDLKTCPGGYVELRQLPYHEMLVRRDRAAKYVMDEASQGKRVEVETVQSWARGYEFQHCIIDHNLEDEFGGKLDFSNAMTLTILDPRVGEEIEEAIDKLHNREEDLAPFPQPASSSSMEATQEPSVH